MNRPDPAARWSELHEGIDPASIPVLHGWLRMMWALARPLVRVPPALVTVAGVAAAVAAALLARSMPALALVLVLLAVLGDGLDGAIAVLADWATPVGRVLDHAADRVSDAAFGAAVWRVGAPWWLALAAVLLSTGLELWREARRDPVLTVNERPTRTICAVLALGCAAASSAAWPATVCAGVWTALAVVALGQRLSRSAGPST